MNYILFSCLFLSVIGCNSFRNEACLDALESRLNSQPNAKNTQFEVVNIRDSITCLDWDSMLIESGYATKESIEKKYEISIPYTFDDLGGDSNCVIFFIKDNIAQRHIDYKITCDNSSVCKTYDFRTLIKQNKQGIISKKDAVFEVYNQEVHDNQGHSWIRENAIRIKK